MKKVEMVIKNKDLKRRLIEISYKHNLSHLGSVLTAVDIIDDIFQQKKPDEKFLLSSGHAGLALYCVLEKYETQNRYGNLFPLDAEGIFNHHGVHPDRCIKCKIDCSTGSLGQGLPIAVGMALADRSKNVYCLISDGECSEGSIWEALRIAKEQKLTNLKVYCNSNGWGAYKQIDPYPLATKLNSFFEVNIRGDLGIEEDFSFLTGQSAHYIIMSNDQYQEALSNLR